MPKLALLRVTVHTQFAQLIMLQLTIPTPGSNLTCRTSFDITPTDSSTDILKLDS